MNQAEVRFDGRAIVVTGAGRGLGQAEAMLLASRGAKVVVADNGSAMAGDSIRRRATVIAILAPSSAIDTPPPFPSGDYLES